ncbi:MAG TPA: hypothetical protein VGE01_01095, partial [Fimbriimonas sp.]
MRGRPAALIGAASLVAAQSSAQAPDVRVRLDAIVSLRSDGTGPASLRFYDPLGHRGVLAVTFFLEPGFRTYVTQKLQQIENDSDQEPLEEYYVEDEGLWKVGKQFLPFGSGQILRESVLAARGDTNLILEGLPVVFAACDGGPGKQRGYVGRIGSRIGLSFALGHHFGIASTALTYVRAPEDAPGLRRGYERVLGFDAYRNIGSVTVRGEAVFLRSGETARDVDEDILDASLSFRPIPSAQLGVGVTRSVAQEKTFVRLTASVVLDHHTTVEPLIRF